MASLKHAAEIYIILKFLNNGFKLYFFKKLIKRYTNNLYLMGKSFQKKLKYFNLI